ncbi:hypothetical protein LINPERPRIM_LOCUS7793, partial [Linum perenne]
SVSPLLKQVISRINPLERCFSSVSFWIVSGLCSSSTSAGKEIKLLIILFLLIMVVALVFTLSRVLIRAFMISFCVTLYVTRNLVHFD